ncbi:MAG TPA: SGNH/GDSL hydrolase family protein [Bryobacteraceae bacterium]|nr:SGNH/GDSL hydrolase family protein [Bryobacteraceae bacterium]
MRFILIFLFGCPVLAQGPVLRTGFPQSGLLAQYRLVDCSGTSCPDSSGNGNAASMVNSPTVGSAGLVMVRASNQYLTVPSGVASSAKTVMVCADFSTEADGMNFAAIWGSATSTNNALLISNSQTALLINFSGYNGSFNVQTAASVGPPGCVTYVTHAGSGDQVYIGSREVAGYLAQIDTSSTMHVDELFGSTGVAAVKSFNGTGYYAALWSTALTAVQVQAAYQAAWTEISARGSLTNYVNTSTSSPLVCVGDSIIYGAVSGTSFCASSNLTLNDTYAPSTIAISGTTAQQWQTMADGYLQLAFAPLARHNTILFMAGTNDIANGASASQTLDRVRSAALHWRALGWQVVYIDMLDRAGVSNATITSFNNLVRSTWRSWADAFADVAADSRFGASGANANSIYFNSGIHPTLVGQNILLGYISHALNSLNGYTEPGCHTFTIPYTNEGFNVASTSAAIQIRLPQQYTKLIGTTIQPTTAFAGTGLTSLTVSLGDSTSATAYGNAFNIFQATGGNVFQDTALFKSTTMSASPPVMNAYFTANTNLGQGSKTITAATNANPSVLTANGNGLSNGNVAYISGFSGNWTPMNGHCIVTGASANSFSCSTVDGAAINATGFGAMTGSPVYTSTFLTAGSVDITSCALQIQ